MSHWIAIFGCHDMGYELARTLGDGQKVVLLDHVQSRVERARTLGFTAFVADFQSDEALREAGIGGKISLLFTLLDKDSENVFLILSARAIDQGLRILTIAEYSDSYHRLYAAGASEVVDPYELSARRIFQMITRPQVVEIIEQAFLSQQDIELVEFLVPADSALVTERLGEVESFNAHKLVLLGILMSSHSHQFMFAAGHLDYRIQSEDVLVLVGRDQDFRAFVSSVS
ncbi:potassium channel family protein [Pleionea litopenaei]|uniref:NAD-binding protein n=1 Tax=Pleionea litopenaei TaxID=3070815 RepID=A0AA51RQ52_9GAMM|nr:NAD-binding protein [Pleionea sp. HL-JVS1]WMS85536.1 NAD-binding protein [Pleionea sp. HL-JVS1]